MRPDVVHGSDTAGAYGRPVRPDPIDQVVLQGLDEHQRACVVHPAGPLLVTAGPGSGKTRVLTRRVAWRALQGDAPAQKALVVTFTRKAAAELTGRLQRLGVEGVTVGTLHLVGMRLLHRYWADTGQHRRAIASSPRRIVQALPGVQAAGAAPSTLLAEFAYMNARCLTPEQYPRAAAAAGRRPGIAPEVVAELYTCYQREKRRRGVIDVDDLLVLLIDALDDPRFGPAVRWRYPHLSVDEAQDLSELHWQAVRRLVADPPDVTLVGDTDQAIYGWNGADPSALARMVASLPGIARLALRRNYRSAPHVAAAANAVLGTEGSGHGAAHTGAPPISTAHTGTAHISTGAGTVTVTAYDDEDAEANGVAGMLRRAAADGVAWHRLAVLGRTHRTLQPLRGALARHGIPHRMAGSLLHEPIVRLALRRLHASDRPDLPGRSCVGALERVVEQLLEQSPAGGWDPEDAARQLARLAELVTEYATVPGARLAGLEDYLRTVLRTDPGTAGTVEDVVEVTTLHRAKGLEWHSVWIVGAEDGLLPLATTADPAEERRLLYVGITRGRQAVHCSWARRRVVDGTSQERCPSPFLAPLRQAAAQQATQHHPTALADGTAHIASLRARLLRAAG